MNKINGGIGSFVKNKFSNFFSLQKPTNPEDAFIKCNNLVKIYQAAELEVFALQGLEARA